MTDAGDGAGERPAPVHTQMVAGAHLRQGWDALGMLLSGMLVFGLPAWWLSEATGQVWILPVALVLGMAAAIYAVWVRYSDPGP
ncbi:hypothetical protein [Blastococcus xanthinilyticus]|uniref:AtpZ/AtpI family protein n=1 Tax=Blastococcus xanthinilyticus TaxID=1564164 RepID=A0A5S5CU63_9ACTN|nr:hypothetical protein [Blastococcus xanthinilyticus]TYP85889.1 hypothetical protein BD833_11130 [Blastococcus xanthinilyticus]